MVLFDKAARQKVRAPFDGDGQLRAAPGGSPLGAEQAGALNPKPQTLNPQRTSTDLSDSTNCSKKLNQRLKEGTGRTTDGIPLGSLCNYTINRLEAPPPSKTPNPKPQSLNPKNPIKTEEGTKATDDVSLITEVRLASAVFVAYLGSFSQGHVAWGVGFEG